MVPKQRFVIAGLGEILWDHYGSQRFLGGAPANFALHVQRLGHQGWILSRIGNDHEGELLLEALKNRKIPTEFIQIDPSKATGSVRVELDEHGIPHFVCSSDVAFDYLEDFSQKIMSMGAIDAVLYGTLAQRNRISRRTIQKFIQSRLAGLQVFDVNIRGIDDQIKEIVEVSLTHSQILKLNQSEVKSLRKLLGIKTEDELGFFSHLLEHFQLEVICLTLGEIGALVVTTREMLYSPGFVVPVLDTTGSGDAFIAGFVVSYLEKKSLRECLEYANALGALITTRKGAVPQYHPQEIERLIQTSSMRNVAKHYERYIQTCE